MHAVVLVIPTSMSSWCNGALTAVMRAEDEIKRGGKIPFTPSLNRTVSSKPSDDEIAFVRRLECQAIMRRFVDEVRFAGNDADDTDVQQLRLLAAEYRYVGG